MERGQKMKINWNDIKNRVNSQQDLFNPKGVLPEEEKRLILKTRAKALAIEKIDDPLQKNIIEVVVFGLANETYGIESTFIREVYPLKDFTLIPGIPSFVLGIINVRGQIVSIVDLKKFFNLPIHSIGELNKIIIIRNYRMEFGVLADTIQGTCSIPIEQIQTPPISTNGIGGGYLKGVSNDHIIILDAERILNDENITIHHELE